MSEAKSNQYLWMAVGVLGVATLGLGAELWLNRTAEVVAHEPVVLVAANEPVAEKSPMAVAVAQSAPVKASPGSVEKNESHIQKPNAALAPAAAAKAVHKPAPVAATQLAPKAAPPHQDAKVLPEQPEPAPAAAPEATAVVVLPEQKPPLVICGVCGTVESVRPIAQEAAQGSGIGAIAGAALGGIVGNQLGGGAGKDLATIAGMVGGGWAGNTVEKKMKKEILYEVKVRMDDGSVRNLEQKSAIGVGTKVTVEGGKLTPA